LAVWILIIGDDGWLQLELNEPVVCLRGDRYILRRPSPGETLGGGVILDPHPSGRHKRYNQKLLQGLETLIKGTPEDILLQASMSLGIALRKDVILRASLDQDVAQTAFESLVNENRIQVLHSDTVSVQADSLIVPTSYWRQYTEKAKDEKLAGHVLNLHQKPETA